jgi:hypothetical protein
MPDLIINRCPLKCDETCAKVWSNETIQHRIICGCVCHYKKNAALVQVDGLDTKASSTYSHPGGISK